MAKEQEVKQEPTPEEPKAEALVTVIEENDQFKVTRLLNGTVCKDMK